MGKLDLEKVAIAAVAGGVDVVLDNVAEAQSPLIVGLSGQDLYDIVVPVGSFLANYMDYETEYTDTIFLATVQSLERVVAKKVMEMMPAAFSQPSGMTEKYYPGVYSPSTGIAAVSKGKYLVTG